MLIDSDTLRLQERFNAGLAFGSGQLRRLSETAISEKVKRVLSV